MSRTINVALPVAQSPNSRVSIPMTAPVESSSYSESDDSTFSDDSEDIVPVPMLTEQFSTFPSSGRRGGSGVYRRGGATPTVEEARSKDLVTVTLDADVPTRRGATSVRVPITSAVRGIRTMSSKPRETTFIEECRSLIALYQEKINAIDNLLRGIEDDTSIRAATTLRSEGEILINIYKKKITTIESTIAVLLR